MLSIEYPLIVINFRKLRLYTKQAKDSYNHTDSDCCQNCSLGFIDFYMFNRSVQCHYCEPPLVEFVVLLVELFELDGCWPLNNGGALVIERVVNCIGTCNVTVDVPSNSLGLKVVLIVKLAFCESRFTVVSTTELKAASLVL